MVAVALAGREAVEIQQAAGKAGYGAAVGRAQAGPVAASLLDGLVKGGVGQFGALALENEVGRLQFVVVVDHQVGVVVGSPPGNVHLKADAFRRVFVLVD